MCVCVCVHVHTGKHAHTHTRTYMLCDTCTSMHMHGPRLPKWISQTRRPFQSLQQVGNRWFGVKLSPKTWPPPFFGCALPAAATWRLAAQRRLCQLSPSHTPPSCTHILSTKLTSTQGHHCPGLARCAQRRTWWLPRIVNPQITALDLRRCAEGLEVGTRGTRATACRSPHPCSPTP